MSPSKLSTVLKITTVVLSAAAAGIAQMWPGSSWANLLTIAAAFFTGGVLVKRPGDVAVPVGTAAVSITMRPPEPPAIPEIKN